MVNPIMPNSIVRPADSSVVNAVRSTAESISSNAPAKTGEDSVRISPFGKRSLLLSKFSSNKSGMVSISSIKEDLLQVSSSVEDRLQEIFRSIGLPSDTEAELSVGLDGNIFVEGDGPDAEAIEEAINRNDELKNNIRKMSANTSLLKAMEKHLEFSAAYEKDPVSAVEQYGYLLDDSKSYHVAFHVQNGKIESYADYF